MTLSGVLMSSSDDLLSELISQCLWNDVSKAFQNSAVNLAKLMITQLDDSIIVHPGVIPLGFF